MIGRVSSRFLAAGRKRRLPRLLRRFAHQLRRWRLRREAAQMVRDPYGDPPFPLSRDQWAELCRYEAERAASGPGDP